MAADAVLIRLRDELSTVVGGADTLEHAVPLAAGFFARTGGAIEIIDKGEVVASLGVLTPEIGGDDAG